LGGNRRDVLPRAAAVRGGGRAAHLQQAAQEAALLLPNGLHQPAVQHRQGALLHQPAQTSQGSQPPGRGVRSKEKHDKRALEADALAATKKGDLDGLRPAP
jgi:hypothetical protein